MATVQRMSAETEPSRCTARTGAVFRLSNGSRSDLRVSSRMNKEKLSFDSVTDRWLQIKWNTIIAPLVREFSMNKCAPSKSKTNSSAAAASTSYESVAGTALYVLLHRAVFRDCPLAGQGNIFCFGVTLTVIDSLHRTWSVLVEFYR